MTWNLELITIRSIPIKVHLTFPLFLIYIAISEWGSELGAAYEVLFILSIFFCVVLHEFGHSIAAKFFGLSTKEITIYPFGGVASIIGNAKPIAEFLIALAGPAVNFIIVFLLTPYLSVPVTNEADLQQLLTSPTFIDRLLITNIFLIVFNMIPAYPMDGGRVLRAILSMILGVRRGTAISLRIAQLLSILIGIYAIYTGAVILAFIAYLIFTSASSEVITIRSTTATINGKSVSDLMIPRESLTVFTHGTTAALALEQSIKSTLHFFPVLYGDSVLGVISKSELIAHAAAIGDPIYVSELMNRNYISVKVSDPLNEVIAKSLEHKNDPILVISEDNLVGMITPENLFEFLLVYGNKNN